MTCRISISKGHRMHQDKKLDLDEAAKNWVNESLSVSLEEQKMYNQDFGFGYAENEE